jgi:uncharacterized membrane protein YfcA
MPVEPVLFAAMLAAVLGGFVRGFTGFGGALIYVPVVSAVAGPQIAATTFLIVDYLLTLPMAVRSIRICRWPTVLPAAIAAVIATPVGAWLLATGDPIVLRWIICIVVILFLGLIVSGWRYRGDPTVAASVGVGGVSGLFAGVGQISGPPVIALWLSGSLPLAIIRANMFCFFGLLGLSSFAAYLWRDLFSVDTLFYLALLGPLYGGALYLGGWAFARTAGASYRPLTYVLVAFAALSSMPIFDGMLR